VNASGGAGNQRIHRRFIIQRGHEHTRTEESGCVSKWPAKTAWRRNRNFDSSRTSGANRMYGSEGLGASRVTFLTAKTSQNHTSGWRPTHHSHRPKAMPAAYVLAMHAPTKASRAAAGPAGRRSD